MSFLKPTLHPGVHSRVKRRMRIIANGVTEGKLGHFFLPMSFIAGTTSANRSSGHEVISQKKKMLFRQELKNTGG